MTDHLAVSRALALAIGWKPEDLDTIAEVIEIRIPGEFEEWEWRTFDYRDPAVIWLIAERYNAFPECRQWRWRTNIPECNYTGDLWAGTAALAVALAVVRAHGGVV